VRSWAGPPGALREYGFHKLLGVDPYIDDDISYPNGVRVLKRSLDDIAGPFDLVMFHHSFEHLADPQAMLGRVHEVLGRGSYALIRMPVVGKAWRDYGVDWFQLDAPRHLFLFSEQGFRHLATSAGFAVERVTYDSTEFQFWASEQYRHDIPFLDQRSHFVDPKGEHVHRGPDLVVESRRPGRVLPPQGLSRGWRRRRSLSARKCRHNRRVSGRS
jgi:SAM-dependent methyltransferase